MLLNKEIKPKVGFCFLSDSNWRFSSLVSWKTNRIFYAIFPQRFGRYILRPSSGVELLNSGTYTELRPLLNPRGSPVLIPLAISGYKYCCTVTRLQSGLMLQPPNDGLLREPTPITVTLCALLDSSEWIFGTYKLNVLTWLGLLLLCMIFFTCAHIQIFYLAFLIIGSHIVFISILGLLSRLL